ncbi:hypothetical protein H6F89_00170 [Cyanobacteria bacterium FACHB-63]|nr:hypothetical protein [Cyanobacteria bacterium FACHB-63]
MFEKDSLSLSAFVDRAVTQREMVDENLRHKESSGSSITASPPLDTPNPIRKISLTDEAFKLSQKAKNIRDLRYGNTVTVASIKHQENFSPSDRKPRFVSKKKPRR